MHKQQQTYIWAGNAQTTKFCTTSPIYISPQISSQSSTIVRGQCHALKQTYEVVGPTSLLDHWCIQRTKDLLGSNCQPVTKGLWNLTPKNHLHPIWGLGALSPA